MIVALSLILALFTLAASTYVSVVCFCVVHRMSKRTSWGLWAVIVSTAALGARAFIESVNFFTGNGYISPITATFTIAAALVLLAAPRINTENRNDDPPNSPLAGNSQ